MENFDEIYKAYYNPVYFYILGLCQNPHIAEEITQESFFKVLKKIDSFKNECSIGTWITEIAKNTFYDYCKKNKLNPEADFTEITDDKNFEESVINKESALEIHKLLHLLEEPYKEVFWMRTFGELSFKEIAGIHGKTESWARVTYHRARMMIKEACENENQM